MVVKYNELLGLKKNDNFIYAKYVPKLEATVAEGKNVKKIIKNLKNRVITANDAQFDVYIKYFNNQIERMKRQPRKFCVKAIPLTSK